jgi:hypothetical protein
MVSKHMLKSNSSSPMKEKVPRFIYDSKLERMKVEKIDESIEEENASPLEKRGRFLSSEIIQNTDFRLKSIIIEPSFDNDVNRIQIEKS